MEIVNIFDSWIPWGLYGLEYMCFMPNCFKTIFIWLIFSSEPLSKRQTIEALALDNIPDKCTSTIDSAVLSVIGTTMMQEVNKSIQVRAYLFAELVVGSLPIGSMAIQVKGTLGISKCN